MSFFYFIVGGTEAQVFIFFCTALASLWAWWEMPYIHSLEGGHLLSLRTPPCGELWCTMGFRVCEIPAPETRRCQYCPALPGTQTELNSNGGKGLEWQRPACASVVLFSPNNGDCQISAAIPLYFHHHHPAMPHPHPSITGTSCSGRNVSASPVQHSLLQLLLWSTTSYGRVRGGSQAWRLCFLPDNDIC